MANYRYRESCNIPCKLDIYWPTSTSLIQLIVLAGKFFLFYYYDDGAAKTNVQWSQTWNFLALATKFSNIKLQIVMIYQHT